MRKLLALLLALLTPPALAQSWIANAPDQSIPYNNHGYLSFVNWVNGCVLQYQTGTAEGATGGYPVCLTTLPSGIFPSYPSQAANTFFAAPSGAPDIPSFRTITALDLGVGTLSPTFASIYATNVTGSAATTFAITGGTSQNISITTNGCNAIQLGISGTSIWNFNCAGTFTPDADNSRAIGSASLRWSTGYFTALGTLGTPVTNGYFTTITPASTTGVTTGTNAAAGAVGEYTTSTVLLGSAVSLTTGVAKDITSVSLTAGDWDCEGNAAYNNNASTTVGQQWAWISLTSNTLPTIPNSGGIGSITLSTPQSGVNGLGSTVVGRFRVNIASTTTVYLSTYVSFTTSTAAAFGFIGCRRVR